MHDFHLVDRSEFDYWDYANFHNHPQAVRIHDDVLRYINDSLKWISTFFPQNNQQLMERKGLNLIGPTIIRAEGAADARSIFALWADLLAHGPPVLRLTGDWSGIEGGAVESESYETIVEDRDKLVSSLRQIADYARQVSESEGRLYILHMGI